MKNLMSIISITFKGGLFFLLPIILVVVLFQKAIHLLQPISHFIGNALGLNRVMAPYLVAIFTLIMICLIAGYISKLGIGKAMINWIENNILTLFPGYKLMKSTFENTAGIEMEKDFPVVMVPIDGWMLAFLVEELDSGEVVVFVPSAPNSWEGNLVIFDKSKVKPSALSQKEVQKLLRQLGTDSKELWERNRK